MKQLNKNELIHFNQFLLHQIRLTSQRKIYSLYRGDKMKALYSKLNIYYDVADPNYDELVKRIFMIGEKARNFYADEFIMSNYDRTISIDDHDERTFNYIFDKINNSLKSKNTFTNTFFDKNELFKQFFLDKINNKQIFSSSILAASDDEQIFFKNYYFILLHQLGSINYKDNSHLVSATKDYMVAEKFAGNHTPDENFIIHAWNPVYRRVSKFKKYGLPTYVGVPYAKQKEFSFVAGILPHYIVGLQITGNRQFLINPNIFLNPITDNLFIDGLSINQENFDEVLKLTNYKKSFEVL